ncbi:hypothetical protein K1719_004682 [Acacia pycnantha]|nr:hypothetical protein K1719_004682 [Acacia pycnantha]
MPYSLVGIDESQPSSSSDGGVTDNAETGNGVPTYQNHKDSDVYVETVKDQSASYHGSTESNNLSLKHNTQETSVESRTCVYRWSPQEWLMHPSLYCKYMERYLSMPLDDDFATIVSSYGEVNGVAPDRLELVEQIEYYFSSDNLTNDVKFQEHMNYHGGWVALPFVASLPEVRELTLNVKVIEEVIKTFSFLLEIKDGTKFIRHRRSGQRWNSFDDELITTSKFATNSTWRCAEL